MNEPLIEQGSGRKLNIKIPYATILWIAIGVVIFGVSRYASEQPEVQVSDVIIELPLNEVEIYRANTNDYATLEVEIADTPSSREMGLMFRESLPYDSGMLFIFENETSVSFWMKNTLIPLDIIYIDRDGYIIEIQENAQPCNVINCPSYPSNGVYLYALEVNGGWSEENNVKVGDLVLIEPQFQP